MAAAALRSLTTFRAASWLRVERSPGRARTHCCAVCDTKGRHVKHGGATRAGLLCHLLRMLHGCALCHGCYACTTCHGCLLRSSGAGWPVEPLRLHPTSHLACNTAIPYTRRPDNATQCNRMMAILMPCVAITLHPSAFVRLPSGLRNRRRDCNAKQARCGPQLRWAAKGVLEALLARTLHSTTYATLQPL